MRLLLIFSLLSFSALAQQIFGGGSGSGGGGISNAVTVSTNCSTAPNCFNVFDDTQIAMTATYTALQNSGGTTGAALTTNDNDAGGEWLQAGAAGSENSKMTLSGSQASLMFSAGFKTTGTVSAPTCWGTNESGSTVTSVSVNVTPTGGSGHILVAMARSGVPASGVSAGTFSDGSNAWTNLFGFQVGAQSPSILMQGGYALNIAGGSYTITYNFGGAFVGNTSIYACEFSSIATSNALDGVGLPYWMSFQSNATTVASGGFFTTAANDLIVAMGTDNSSSATWSAGPMGFTSTVTTQASDPVFTSKDVGKKFLITTSCDALNGYINCYQAFAPGQIVSVTSPHVVQVNSLPALTNSSTGTNFTGWLIWGHDDVAQIKAAWTAALAIAGSALVLPCGNMMVGQPPFLSSSAGMAYNPNIVGCAGTTIIPTADYDYSLASGGIFYSYTNANNSGFGNGFQNPYLWANIRDVTVFGGGVDGSQNTIALPMFNLSLTALFHVGVIGWNWNATTSPNSLPAFKGPSLFMQNCINWGAGTGGVIITGDQTPTNTVSSIIDSFFGVQGLNLGSTTNRGDGLVLQGGYVTSRNTQYNPADSTPHAHGVTVSGGWFISVGDQIGLLNVTGGRVFLKDSSTQLLNGNGITNAGGAISAQDTQINTLTQTSGSFIDEGGNYQCATQPSFVPCQGAITPWTTKTLSGGTFFQTYVPTDSSASVASAAALALPTNPNFVITGTTGVTSVTSQWPGRSGTLITTGGAVAFASGATIGASCTTTQNKLYNWYSDGTKFWMSGSGC